MKKLNFKGFCLILFLFCYNTSQAQQIDSLSTKISKERKGNLFTVEPFIYMPYYFAHSNPEIYGNKINYKNYWNYGGGILISNYIGKLKTTTGFYFSSKNYYRDNGTSTLLDKISYWNIPLLFALKTKGKFSPFIGLIFNKPYFYNNINNKELIIEVCDSLGFSCFGSSPGHTNPGYNPPQRWYLLNETIKIGTNFVLKEYKHGTLAINLACDYKLNNDIVIGGSDYSLAGSKSMVDGGRFSIILGINFELFKNRR